MKSVAKLRQVDVLMAQGKAVADAVRAIDVTEVIYHRWRNEYHVTAAWHLRETGVPSLGAASIDAAQTSDDTR